MAYDKATDTYTDFHGRKHQFPDLLAFGWWCSIHEQNCAHLWFQTVTTQDIRDMAAKDPNLSDEAYHHVVDATRNQEGSR